MIDLDELMRLRNEATPGPWKVNIGDFESEDGYGTVMAPYVEADGKTICVPFDRGPDDENDEADAAYIVAACNAVPELVATVRELKEQVTFLNHVTVNLAHNPCLTCVDNPLLVGGKVFMGSQKCPTPETPCHARNGELCMSDNHLACAQAVNEDSFIMRRVTEVK